MSDYDNLGWEVAILALIVVAALAKLFEKRD